MTREYNIAVIPGDGIGQEVTPEGLKILKAIAKIFHDLNFNFEIFPWGSSSFLSQGRMMPKNGLKTLESFDAIYFGAVGFPGVPDHISLRGLRLEICQSFDQYVNLRPARLLPGIKSPLRDKTEKDINFIVIRENTEGEYSGAGGRVHRNSSLEVATQVSIFTRIGVERVIHFAFDMANDRPRKRLASVTKSNAQEYNFGLWDEIFKETSTKYLDIFAEQVLVDAMAARFVLYPESIDVVVASNLFGDILTDLSGAICGSLGMAPSANLNPERRYPSMFEPIHGSALDISGKGIANPIAMIWSGALMLEYLQEFKAADLVLSAIKAVTKEGKVLTPDLGGNATTREVGDAILLKLSKLGEELS